jgi:hypothetical protein
MSLDGWKKNPDGTLDLLPLVAFETLASQGVLCGLKIHYVEHPGQLVSGERSSVQLVLKPEMARQLANALIKAADKAETGSETESRH